MNPRTASLVAALTLVIGCSKSEAPVSVSAKGAEVATAAASAPLDLGNGILLDRVRVVVRKLVLERARTVADAGSVAPCDGCCCTKGVTCHDAGEDGLTGTEEDHDSDGDSSHDTSDDVVLGPLLADLSSDTLAGGLDRIFDGKMPEGTYEEMEFVIGPIATAAAGSDAALAEMAAQNASIIVEGSVDAKPFTFVSSLTAEFEIEENVVVSSGKTGNITLSLGAKNWFGGSGAARCDPTDPACKVKIEKLIRAAIHAFQDDDRNGHDDHDGNDHSGDGPCDD